MANKKGFNAEEVNRILNELALEANEAFQKDLTVDDIRLLLGVHRKSLIHFIRNKKHFGIPSVAGVYYNRTKAAFLEMEKQLKEQRKRIND